VNACRNCDLLVGKLWENVQSTPGYKDATTLVFTTDHGRHNDKPDQLKGGFASHGDSCPGCQHVFLLIVGPDAKRGAVADRQLVQSRESKTQKNRSLGRSFGRFTDCL
jgi:arylsulfatase A-like enzyme